MPARPASTSVRAAPPALRAALLAGAVAAIAAPGAPAATALGPAERAAALRLAAGAPWSVPAPARRAAPGAGRTGDHPLGVQTLLVSPEERKGAADDPGRRAHVYQYDHGSGRARRVLVDVVPAAARGVLGQRALDGTHLPLNAAERAWVRARLAASAPLIEALAAERAARGLPAADPPGPLAALDAKVGVHEPADPRDPCARTRCALVSLFGADGTVSSVEPVVRFADGAVGRPGRMPPAAPRPP